MGCNLSFQSEVFSVLFFQLAVQEDGLGGISSTLSITKTGLVSDRAFLSFSALPVIHPEVNEMWQ